MALFSERGCVLVHDDCVVLPMCANERNSYTLLGMCVCVCVSERERVRVRERALFSFSYMEDETTEWCYRDCWPATRPRRERFKLPLSELTSEEARVDRLRAASSLGRGEGESPAASGFFPTTKYPSIFWSCLICERVGDRDVHGGQGTVAKKETRGLKRRTIPYLHLSLLLKVVLLEDLFVSLAADLHSTGDAT